MRWIAVFLFIALAACSDDDQVSGNNNDVDMSDMGADTATGDMSGDMAQPPVFNTTEEAIALVNPFIGSGGLGFAYAGMTPAAQIPNGMVKVGSDTTMSGNHPRATHHFSGYYDLDPHIRGFSHLHLVGTGTADYANLRIMPNTAENLADKEPGRWWQTSDKEREDASPGEYIAFLEESQTLARMTATKNGAIHHYTWEGDTPRIITVDASASVDDTGVMSASIQQAGSRVTGFVEYDGAYVGRSLPFTLFYVIEFDVEPTQVDGWEDGEIEVDRTSAAGQSAGLVLYFDGADEVRVKVAVSLIDAQQAQDNFIDQIGSKTYDDVKAEAVALWSQKLARLKVAGGDERDRSILFTALYNTYRMPTRFDESGRYRGLDGEIHDTDHPYYTDLSLWDTYRSLHPWYVLYDPEIQRDVLNSLLKMAADGGYVPAWPAGLSYTGGMVGTPADILFGDSAIKGINGVDYATAFDALVASHNPPDGAPFRGRSEHEAFLQFGYVPADVSGESAALTLEYAANDSGMAALAEVLERDDVDDYRARAKYYQNIFEPESAFLRTRMTDGSWEEPFRPNQFSGRSGGPYTEGTGWHWTLHVPHDPAGLAETMGQEAFREKLEQIFEGSGHFDGNRALWALPDTYYWHGNQPPLHNVFMWATAGDLAKLGYWTRQIQKTLYDTTPDGIIGNDDGGTLSSWYIFSAAGFYPVITTTEYFPSPPLFDVMQIELQNGNTIEITSNNSEGVEIAGFTVNGSESVITHEQLVEGARIHYEFSAPASQPF